MAGIKVVPTWAWLLAIAVAFVIGIFVGISIGKNSRDAGELKAVNKGVAQAEKRDATTSEVSTQTRAAGNAAQVATEGATYEAQERIRYIYRDRVVAADCRQPDGVLVEIRAATERANRAVRAAAGEAGPGLPDG